MHRKLCVSNKTLSRAQNTTLTLKKHLSSIDNSMDLVAKDVEQGDDSLRRGNERMIVNQVTKETVHFVK